jgi:ADP-dependent phosphofructokinase/glucokinase
MITLEKEIIFSTNDYWTADKVNIVFDDDHIKTIDKARKILNENKDFERISIHTYDRFELITDDNTTVDDVEQGLFYVYTTGFVFYCQSNWDSSNQMESDWFVFSDLGLSDL